jgi:hypothetical protein
MLSLLKSFFGGKKPQFLQSDLLRNVTEGLDIDAAIMAHENWKLRLEAYLAGRSTEDLRPEVICFDDRCDLGKWIHSKGRERLGAFPGFSALTEHHRMFHYVASNVVSMAHVGKKGDAERMLRGVYAENSAAVVKSLRQLQEVAEMGSKKA